MNRRVLLLGTGVAALAVLGFAAGWWMVAPKHRITMDTFDALEAGLPRSQAHALVGVPPGDYAVGDVQVLVCPGNYESVAALKRQEGGPAVDLWVGPTAALVARLDDGGRLQHAHLYVVERRDESLLRKVRRRLRL